MHPLLRTAIFTVIVPGTVTIVVPYLLLGGVTHPSVRGWGIVGIVLIVGGATIYASCAWHFSFAGRGTPAPIDPPRFLVAKGSYRLMRNPMYVGVDSVLFGEALLFRSTTLLTYALCAWVIQHLFVVLYEEPTLRRTFGRTYETYCEAVPRWIPRAPGGRR